MTRRRAKAEQLDLQSTNSVEFGSGNPLSSLDKLVVADVSDNGEGKVATIQQIIDLVTTESLGALAYQGTWNPSTNTPALSNPPGVEQNAHYYIANAEGTALGFTFKSGDWIVSDGLTWEKVDNSDVTKEDLGLENVDNTSDADKPISTATATALGTKQDTLVSGTNIKTFYGQSLLGSGNLLPRPPSAVFVPDTPLDYFLGDSAAQTVDTYLPVIVNQQDAYEKQFLYNPTDETKPCVCTVVNNGTAPFFLYNVIVHPGSAEKFFFLPTGYGSKWVPFSKNPTQMLLHSSTQVVTPVSTSTYTAKTLTMPGGVLGPNGWIDVFTSWTCSPTANNKVIKISYGGTEFGVITVSSSSVSVIQAYTRISNRGVENSQIALSGASSGYNALSTAPVVGVVDTTTSSTLQITAQKASDIEDLILESCSIFMYCDGTL